MASRNKLETIPSVCIIKSHAYLFCKLNFSMYIKFKSQSVSVLNLRPGKRILVAIVKDEAGVLDVFTMDPGC